MGTDRNWTSSGSKSRDTRGSEPSQDDVKDELQGRTEEGVEVSATLDEQGKSGPGAKGRTAGKGASGKTTRH